jgi:hypothetical protein
MTIAVAAGPGGSALYLLRDGADRREVAIGAALPALFWSSMGAAFAFPGTAGLEAGFPQYVPRVGGVWIDERSPRALMTAGRTPTTPDPRRRPGYGPGKTRRSTPRAGPRTPEGVCSGSSRP